MKYLLLVSFIFLAPAAFCQSATIHLSADTLDLSTPDSATVSVSVTATSFTAQLYLEVAYSELPGQVSVTFPKNPLDYPYSDGQVKIKNSGGASGSYKLVIKAANGPVEAYDTCIVQVTNLACTWNTMIPDITSSYSGMTEMAIDRNGVQWYCTGYGLVKYENGIWTEYPPSYFGLTIGELDDVEIDANDNVWFSSEEGLTYFTGTSYVNYLPSNSQLQSDNIYSIQCDDAGNVWLGTDNGLAKFDGTFWTTYTTSNSSLTSNYIENITLDADGNLWIICMKSLGNDDLLKFDGVNWTNYSASDFCLSGFLDFADITVDHSGQVWIGLQGNMFQVLKIADSEIEAWGRKETANASNHTVRLRSDCSIVIEDKTSLLSMADASGITSSNGEIWLSGNANNIGRIAKFKNNNWDMFSHENSNLQKTFIFDHVIDQDGIVWTLFNKSTNYVGPYINYLECNEPVITSMLASSSGEGFDIFPNPGTDVIQISALKESGPVVELTIIDSQGRMVFSDKAENINALKINVADLEQGIYLVSMKTREGVSVKRFIKN